MGACKLTVLTAAVKLVLLAVVVQALPQPSADDTVRIGTGDGAVKEVVKGPVKDLINSPVKMLKGTVDKPLTAQQKKGNRIMSILDDMLASKEAVDAFTTCFKNPKSCKKTKWGYLIGTMREQGKKGDCKDCDPKEEHRINEAIYRYMKALRETYPKEFRDMIPHIAALI